MRVRIVVVSPLRQNNLGYIARLMGNFGLSDLCVVNPRCRIAGKTAVKFSKHSHDVLDGAKLFSSIKSATEGYASVGTTAIWHKSERSKLNVYELDKALEMLRKARHPRIAIVLGRDDTGLTKAELEMLDMNLFIPTHSRYTTLNIAHALAIILYNLRRRGSTTIPRSIYSGKRQRDLLAEQLSLFVGSSSRIRKKGDVIRTFNRVISRSNPTKAELRTMSALFSIDRNSGHGNPPKRRRGRSER